MSFFIRRWKETVIFLTAYIPILLIRPGSLNADIKQYLHLDIDPPNQGHTGYVNEEMLADFDKNIYKFNN